MIDELQNGNWTTRSGLLIPAMSKSYHLPHARRKILA